MTSSSPRSRNASGSERQRAVAAANQELLRGYWGIAAEILRRQQQEGWGAKVIDPLAADLRTEFPGVNGFSRPSLHHMRRFAAEWPDGPFVQAGLGQISWYHHLALLDKLDDPGLRVWYDAKAAQNGRSRDVLAYQIGGRMHDRQGRALTNFDRTLPPPDSSQLAGDPVAAFGRQQLSYRPSTGRCRSGDGATGSTLCRDHRNVPTVVGELSPSAGDGWGVG